MTTNPNRFSAATLTLVILLMAAILPQPSLATEDVPSEAKGYQNSNFDFSEIESINMTNGNLTLRIPLYSLATDGGLTYALTLFYNSKLWAHRVIYACKQPGTNQRLYRGTAMADGVENFGFGWDMRPPRLQMDACRKERSTDDCAEPSLARPLAWVDPTGAKHYLYTVPPWQGDLLGSGFSYLCDFETADYCYSWDGSNIKITPQSDEKGNLTGAIAEDGSGVKYIHEHLIEPCDDDVLCNNSYYKGHPGVPPDPDVPPDVIDFREDVAGIYLTAIEKGPWSEEITANRIELSYCDEENCGNGEPWLVSKIEALDSSDAILRSVTFNYGTVSADGVDYTVLDSLDVPAFDPIFGGTDNPESSRIHLYYSTDQEFQRDVDETPDPCDVGPHAARDIYLPFLSKVVLGSGRVFEFFRDQSSEITSESEMIGVILPTGATVHYQFWGYFHSTAANYRKCSTPMPPPGECDQSNIQYTSGIFARTETSYDAEQVIRGRQSIFESTEYSEPWPYNFSYELDGGPPTPETYSYTMVQNYAYLPGDDEAPRDTLSQIYRFNNRTHNIFSIDQLLKREEAAKTTSLPGEGEPEYFDLGLRGDYKILRHEEIERIQKHALPVMTPLVTPTQEVILNRPGDEAFYVKKRRVYTNEGVPDSDVGLCYLEPSLGEPTGCNITVETLTVDDYFNQTRRELDGPSSTDNSTPGDFPLDRHWASTFEPLSEDPWYFSLMNLEEVCDGTTACSRTRNKWLPTNGYYRLVERYINPADAEADLTCTQNDCIKHVFGYDTAGNLISDEVSGGYGNGMAPGPTTDYEYQHGRPVKKWLWTFPNRLLVWQREVDAGTGLVRWHVDGSGAGLAYSYDDSRRVTDIVPIEVPFDEQGAPGTPVMQRNAVDSALYGTRIEYDEPDPAIPGDLLTHTIFDSTCVINGSLVCSPVRGYRGKHIFDGLGRSTQVIEKYPGTSGYRSQFKLSYLHYQTLPVYPDYEPLEATRVDRVTEWVDGENWLTDMEWTETQNDDLGRPILTIRPDGTLTRNEYRGDSIVTNIRSVATASDDIFGSQEELRTIETKDGLGRLRTLTEQIESSPSEAPFEASYTYNQADQLTEVVLPSPDGAQTRSFSYSPGGFLTQSLEPERTTTFGRYDALGSLRQATSEGITTEYVNDDFGRPEVKRVDGNTTASFTFGTSLPGQPNYGRLKTATASNWFGR
ncbi:MAG: hypothetical protein GY832_16430, partial [Chloroflexi bacterium]|nr:hypothetical protein [Chloroflexota bacterium]